uniref:Putative polygalacturonase n=1 Tax=uncultured microorganism TaxID=358574 RepID=B1PLI6_9ZZZZ|nr:putative polygalacturonase [uncultured microorganism]
MKKIFKLFGAFLIAALMGAFSACNILDPNHGLEDLGLGIKVFFPTKVVTGQPMTINGSGFLGAREIVFPGNVKVTDFEIVSNDMIRVTAPAGIAAEGGKLVINTADQTAESRLDLTLGSTQVSGFSKQEGEEIAVGEQLTIYGQDLEFINKIELLDADNNPLYVDEINFYRKGSSEVIVTIPKQVLIGTFAGKIHTYDGREFSIPELMYTAAGGGHWETTETTIWDQETAFADWSATIVIGPEKFADVKEGDIIRVYIKDKGDDYNPIFKHVDSWGDWNEFQANKTDEDGYFEAPVPADAIPELQTSGLRFQGIGFTIVKVGLIQETWVDGGGHWETQKSVIWDQETAFADWSATIVIGPEQFADVVEGGIIRVYIKDKGDDYNPIFKHVDSWGDWNEFQANKTDEDGYFEAPVPADAIPELQTSGLRFQGIGFTIVKVELIQDVWVDGGGHWESQKIVLWDQETAFADWSATIVIGPEQFANVVEGGIIRVYIKDKGDDYNPIFKHVDSWGDWNEFQANKVDEDGYFEAPVPAEAIEELQTSGLRFQGIGFTITKVELLQDVWVDGGGTGGDTGPVAIWDQETVFGDWSATIVIGPEKFTDVKNGDVIRVYIKDKGDDYNPIYKHVDSWGDWNEFQANKVDEDGYFEAPVPAEAIEELQTSGLRFQGIGFTITKVELIPA